jgi:hypothetical protein
VRAAKLDGELFDVSLPIDGFTTVHDAPFDPKAFEEAQRQAQQVRAEQIRRWGGPVAPIPGLPPKLCPNYP